MGKKVCVVGPGSRVLEIPESYLTAAFYSRLLKTRQLGTMLDAALIDSVSPKKDKYSDKTLLNTKKEDERRRRQLERGIIKPYGR